MKSLMSKLVAITLCVVTLFGCQTDNEAVNSQVGESGNVFSISIADTSRTQLGDKSSDGIYRVYWSEDDKIAINGHSSCGVNVDESNPSTANFFMDVNVSVPYNVTYPYSAATTAECAVVEFPAEQNYVEGTFDVGSAPMCGYAATASTSIKLRHLAGVLRFPVVANKSDVVLEKIVITSSTAKLSGEFSVNCESGEVTARESAGNSVTYHLPANFTLSESEASVFYITLPAVNTGDCTIEFVESCGGKMAVQWSNKSIMSGIVREFKTVEYRRGTSCALSPMESEEDEILPAYPEIIGYVKDTDGNPIENVVVSDGFICVATDHNGRYSMTVSSSAWYVYLSLPSEYEVPINEYGQPCFYQKLESGKSLYNFTLKPLAGGKEKRFALFAFGDPQVLNNNALVRFNNEAVPGIKKHADEVLASGMNCYGITLGDIISNTISSNDEQYRDDMRDGFSVSRVGLPVFQVMGNHDYSYFNPDSPLIVDSRSPNINLKAQRFHEIMFGPINYSFNRGDVHIIGMKDIVFNSNTDGGDYSRGFTKEEYEWLKQDLSFVPKDKAVMLCVHIQLLNNTTNYIAEVMSLLNQYSEAHIVSGHTHINRNYEHAVEGLSTTKIFEHNAGALCGAWWCSNICGDGVPNGFQVYIGGNEGTKGKLVDWYHIGYHEGLNVRSHQMRLYRGNAVTGGEIEGTNTYGVKGYYGFNYSDDVLLANIYNADSKWTVKVYEDGVHTGNMEKIAYNNASFTKLIGSYTKEDPRRSPDGVGSSHDMYVAGLFLGVLGRYGSSGLGNGSWAACFHMYKYTLKNKDAASIKVEAIDRFGNVYTETKITEGTDYTGVY